MITEESIGGARQALTLKLRQDTNPHLTSALQIFDQIVADTLKGPYKYQVHFDEATWTGEKFNDVFYDRERPGHKLKNLRGVPAQVYAYLTLAGFKPTVEPFNDSWFNLVWER
jgi:hypothetical protein